MQEKRTARERILDAAIESFRTYGYARTTTVAIAEEANVAEITIFRHFKNKQRLFQEAVKQISSEIDFDRLQEQITGDLHSDLLLISRQTLQYFIKQQETISMILFESTHFPEMQEALAQNSRRHIQFLSDYFQQRQEQKQIRNMNSEALARMFISMQIGYALGIDPIKTLLPVEMSLVEVSEHFVNVFLNGITLSEGQGH